MSCKHLYIGMPMYNSHTWIAVMLWFRTSWLCPPACSADLTLSRIHPGGQVLPPLAFLLWTAEIMFDPCKWHGLVPGVLLASGCSVDLPLCDPRGSPVRATWMGSLPSGFRLVWPMRSPGRKWEGERMRRVRSGYLFPWLPLPVVSHQDDCVPQWQVSLLWNVSVRSVPSTFC